MKIVTVREFRDRATEMFRSEEVLLITRSGLPAGFFLPWSARQLPADARREAFLRLSQEIGMQLKAQGVTAKEVMQDFAARRRRR